jgi:peptidoglycan/xylan/chitin deacetylase (PgdA/CDA1 family)
MSQKLTIIAYHYVRDLPHTRYPEIKGLLTSEFKGQLAYLKKNYKFVTVSDCLNALYLDASLPDNACLLTFDDGYIDHFTTVLPLLDENNIQGCFFPPAKAILSHEVLDVNKIHFILASTCKKLNRLLEDIYACLDKYRSDYHLQSNDHYYSKLAVKNRFDPAEVIFIKRLLQVELPENVRKLITDELFQKYVTKDEKAFAAELYMSPAQIRGLSENGMYVGSHGFNHYWLDKLPPEKQEFEIDQSLEFLRSVNAPTENWIMCYPYGGYNDSVVEILKKKKCAFALTTKPDMTHLSRDNAYTLERFDTNDFPKML